MLQVAIRQERAGDEEAVRAVNDGAFGRPLESGIVDGIRGTDRWIDGGSIVAETPDGIVGHLLISEGDLVSDDRPTRRIWLIGPVAVRPDSQRKGVGGAMMRAAIEYAIQRAQPVLCLLGHDTYYPRFGFGSARALGIEPPHEDWGDQYWMALRLPAWEPSCRGKVRYPPSFPD